MDGLIHINEISWQRITNPSELLHISQPIKAVIIKIEEGTNKISLSIKKLSEDPFKKAINNFEVGKIYPAVVTNVQDYGCFARLAEGLEGLIHQSQLSWTKKNIHPGKVLSTSQSIKVQILEKDLPKRRLSLSYKNTLVNPWVKFTKEQACIQPIFYAADPSNGNYYTRIGLISANQFFVNQYNNSAFVINLKSSASLRDMSAWYNLVVAVDTPQATDTNRVKMYINGELLTSRKI